MTWRRGVPLSEHTRYRIGGPARRFARAESREELRELLASLDGEGHIVLGGGANLLVADEGVEESVVTLRGELDRVEVEPGERFEAGAAAPLPAFVGAARRAGLTGYGILEAVPGTVGGALRMNAGSARTGIWERVLGAEAMTPEGEVERIAPEEAGAGYRHVGVPEDWVFLGARFASEAGDPERVEEEHMRLRRRKVEAQVYDVRSVGSTWKNPGPPHGSAWEVVDRVGMRGERRGEAQISPKHANFIVNHGGARADDVLRLMAETHRRAREELGVRLEPEIRLWGFSEEERRSVGDAP